MKTIISVLVCLCPIFQFFGQAYISQPQPVIEKESQELKDTLQSQCSVIWQDAMMGSCIGRNKGLIPYDLDNDGTMELIVNAGLGGYCN